jgi:hypothetical protein
VFWTVLISPSDPICLYYIATSFQWKWATKGSFIYALGSHLVKPWHKTVNPVFTRILSMLSTELEGGTQMGWLCTTSKTIAKSCQFELALGFKQSPFDFNALEWWADCNQWVSVTHWLCMISIKQKWVQSKLSKDEHVLVTSNHYASIQTFFDITCICSNSLYPSQQQDESLMSSTSLNTDNNKIPNRKAGSWV